MAISQNKILPGHPDWRRRRTPLEESRFNSPREAPRHILDSAWHKEYTDEEILAAYNYNEGNVSACVRMLKIPRRQFESRLHANSDYRKQCRMQEREIQRLSNAPQSKQETWFEKERVAILQDILVLAAAPGSNSIQELANRAGTTQQKVRRTLIRNGINHIESPHFHEHAASALARRQAYMDALPGDSNSA